MPLYEYECRECHRRTEKIQKFSDAELTICPYCSGPLERTITAPNVHFAGGGWYKDGYSSVKPGATGGDSAGSGAEAPSASAGNTAPASTPAPAAAPAASAPAAAPASSGSGTKA